MRKICARLYFFPQCARFAQACTYFLNAQYTCKICARLYLFPQCTIYEQDLRKIVLISSMRNICARFAQDCNYFLNAQYMSKICARLYFFPRCAIYAQDLRKIVLLSSMRNICARFVQDCTSSFSGDIEVQLYFCHSKALTQGSTRCAQDCTSFLNVQDVCKIVLFPSI